MSLDYYFQCLPQEICSKLMFCLGVSDYDERFCSRTKYGEKITEHLKTIGRERSKELFLKKKKDLINRVTKKVSRNRLIFYAGNISMICLSLILILISVAALLIILIFVDSYSSCLFLFVFSFCLFLFFFVFLRSLYCLFVQKEKDPRKMKNTCLLKNSILKKPAKKDLVEYNDDDIDSEQIMKDSVTFFQLIFDFSTFPLTGFSKLIHFLSGCFYGNIFFWLMSKIVSVFVDLPLNVMRGIFMKGAPKKAEERIEKKKKKLLNSIENHNEKIENDFEMSLNKYYFYEEILSISNKYLLQGLSEEEVFLFRIDNSDYGSGDKYLKHFEDSLEGYLRAKNYFTSIGCDANLSQSDLSKINSLFNFRTKRKQKTRGEVDDLANKSQKHKQKEAERLKAENAKKAQTAIKKAQQEKQNKKKNSW